MTLEIPAGPGHLDIAAYPHGLGADVELGLEYVSHAPEGATRAVLHLRAYNIEEGHADTAVGIELTKGDLVDIMGTIVSLMDAIEEDESA